MKKHLTTLLLFLGLSLSNIAPMSAQTAPSGTGTIEDPYLISSFSNLIWLSTTSSAWDKVCVQTADIDASSLSIGSGFPPIATSTGFTGTYNGNGHFITNLYINLNTSTVGLFASIGNGGTVRNLHLRNVNVKGTSAVGGLAGFLQRTETLVKNVSVTGTVTGTGLAVGGLIGQSFGSIIQCSAEVTVSSSDSQVGGLVGQLATESGIIRNSYSNSTVSSTKFSVGGLVGQTSQNSLIENCYSTGTVSSAQTAGGLVGYLDQTTTINTSFTTVSVTGTRFIGGITGAIRAGLSFSSNCYWDTEISGLSSSPVGSGISTAQSLQKATFVGFDFVNHWEIDEGNSRPHLKAFPYRKMNLSISGTDGWRIMGNPLKKSEFATFTKNLWTQGFVGATESGGNPNVLVWDEPTQNWLAPDSLNAAVSKYQGFAVFVYEDDDAHTPGVQGGFPKSIVSSGYIDTLAQTLPLSYTNGTNAINDGFNLVANPSTSTIDWTKVTLNNVNDTYYVWDSENNHYDAYSVSTGGVNGGTQLIPSFQGFWVKANAVSASVTIDSTAFAVVNKNRQRPMVTESDAIHSVLLHLENGEAFSDQARLVIRDQALEGIDNLDAVKMTPMSQKFISISTIVESVGLLIDSRPFAQELRYQLKLQSMGTNDSGILSIAENALPENWVVSLLNMSTGDIYNLLDEHVEVNLEQIASKSSSKPNVLFSDAEETESEWEIVISVNTTTSAENMRGLPTEFGLSQNYPNPFNPSTVITYQLPENSKVVLNVFDTMGRIVATLVNGQVQAGFHQVQFNAGEIASGVYFYRLQAGNNVFTKKLTLIK